MYYLAFIRKTALWCSIGFILGGSSSFIGALAFYILLAGMHILICRIRSSRRTPSEIFFGALCADLSAPFSHVATFLAIITRKHIIRDDSAWHNFTDFIETVVGFIWSVFIALFIVGCLL